MESVTQKNSLLTVVIDDFSARLSKWWTDDKTTQEGLNAENLLSQLFLSQVINKLTLFSQNFKLYWSVFYESTKFKNCLGSSSFTSF